MRYCVYRESGFFIAVDERAFLDYVGYFRGRRVFALQGGLVRPQFTKSERGDLWRDVLLLC